MARTPAHSPYAIGLALAAASLAVATAAHATATLTYPSNGTTVKLDKNANFTFSWTLPPDETNPQVEVGDQPGYDHDTFAPFEGICGVNASATSCRPDSPIHAGTHYAFVDTTDTDVTQHFDSHVTSFVVPPVLALGCGPLATCTPRGGIKVTYEPHPPGPGPPNSDLELTAWFNGPDDSAATFSFAVRRGHTVLVRVRDSEHSSELAAESGFELTHTQVRWGHHRKRWHAPPGGAHLTCKVTVSAGGLTLTRTVRMKSPPR